MDLRYLFLEIKCFFRKIEMRQLIISIESKEYR